MGIIYLIQPAELVGTNRYKIGCSSKNTNERIKCGYRKGTRIILIYNCNKHYCIERKIKNCFTQKYSRIAGNEYFQGDEHDIILTFKQVIHECGVSIDDGITLRVDNSDKTIECCSYNNDVSYNKPIDPVKPNDKKDRFHCEKCQYSTIRKSQWLRHIKTKKHKNITNPSNFICQCGNKYKHNSNLSRHKKTCTLQKNTDNTQNIVFDNDISYNKHTVQNQSNNMYKFHCEICNFKSNNKNHYNEHLQTKKHGSNTIYIKTGKKEYKSYNCDICSFKSKNKYHYQEHLQTKKHKTNKSNINPAKFTCQCGKKYKHHSSFSRHKKTCAKSQSTSTQEIPSTKDDDIINVMKDLIQKNNQLEDMLLKYSNPTS